MTGSAEPGSSISSNASFVLAASKGLAVMPIGVRQQPARHVGAETDRHVGCVSGQGVPGATTVPPWQVSTMSPTSSVKPSARSTGGTATDALHWNGPATRVAIFYLRTGQPREEGQHS